MTRIVAPHPTTEQQLDRGGEGARVVLADDHAATRAGVRFALGGRGFTIVAEVATADAAVEEAVRQRPELCLIDLSIPGGGINAARRIHADVPDTRIIVLTTSRKTMSCSRRCWRGPRGTCSRTCRPRGCRRRCAVCWRARPPCRGRWCGD